MPEPILKIEDLSVAYRERGRTLRAADGVSLTLDRGSTLALVGESGCGKTTVGLSILNLLPFPGAIDSGRVLLDGRDVLSMPADELRRVRGRRISMIFQDPIAGLNPVLSIGAQVEEIVRTHQDLPKRESRGRTIEALRKQGLPNPEQLMSQYPFELSGGMCQRVMIAIATVLQPQVIVADEPTSALDVTVQAGILRELNELKRDLGASILLITHDLGVVAQMADEVAVMYAGRIVERAAVREIYARPAHPYMAALLAARPRLDADRRPLQPIRGAPPDLGELTGECGFLPRCTKAINQCRSEPWPRLEEIAPSHTAACFNPVFHAEPERV
jgi:oligopeptide/dipeptide ABC transporter ATP-binding protein